MNRRAAAISMIAALALTGCGSDGGGGELRREAVTVYVSAPLRGARAAEGRAIVNGARLALAQARGRVGALRVRAVYMDDTVGGRWSLARSAGNARRAAEDATAIGYIGDLDSGATRVSLPITNQAEMVQISPGSTAVDLTRPVGDETPERLQPSDRRTFARVVPDDATQGRAGAVWAKRQGTRAAVSLSDRSQFGRLTAEAFLEEARHLGLRVRFIGAPGQFEPPSRLGLASVGRDAIYYGGSAGPAVAAVRKLAAGASGALIIGSDALIDPVFLRGFATFADRLRLTSPLLDPSLLPARGQRFVRAYRRRFGSPNATAAYGYEAMALLLDAMGRAGSDADSRNAVIDEVLATHDRRSVLGTYTIDGNGDTTFDAVSGYRISDGLPVFPLKLEAPR